MCVLVNRERLTHTHTHIASSAVLNLQAHTHQHIHTHTHGNVSVDHKEMRQDSQKGALFIWGTQIWQVLLK